MSIAWTNLRHKTFCYYDPDFARRAGGIFTSLRCAALSPPNTVLPRASAKCHGTGWERFDRPGDILENANVNSL